MQPTLYKLYIAVQDCHSIGARKNDIIIQLPSGHVCVFHSAEMKELSEEDRANLIPYPIVA
jgi:hypothetical protein